MKILVSVTKYIVILLLFLCSGCSRGKYYVADTFRDGTPANIRSINLDTSYHFYIRQVYKDKDENSQNILRSNVSKTDTANKVRIEVEYLLLSWLHKNVIYITTVPDKFQQYYSKHVLPDTIINAYDFSTFHFGKLSDDGETVAFVSDNGSKKVSWELRPLLTSGFPKQLFLRELYVEKKEVVADVILVDKALQEQVVFTKQPAYSIIFNKPGTNGDDGPSIMKCRLVDGKIYFYQYHRGMDVLFRFSCNINEKDSTIGFNYKRSIYDSRPLTGAGN